MTAVISQAAAQAQLNAFGARVNGGKLQIYDGARPANPQTAVTTQVKLLEFTLNNPAFNAATMQAANLAQALANVSGIPDATGLANSTASWGRVLDSSGNAVWDGDVGTGTTDFQLVTTTISTTSAVTLTSITITQPTGA